MVKFPNAGPNSRDAFYKAGWGQNEVMWKCWCQAVEFAYEQMVTYQEKDRQKLAESARNTAPSQAPGAEGMEAKYNELLFAVERKFEGETRHETALRYIRQAEKSGYTNATTTRSKP